MHIITLNDTGKWLSCRIMLSFTILDISTVQKKLLDLCDNKNDVFSMKEIWREDF